MTLMTKNSPPITRVEPDPRRWRVLGIASIAQYLAILDIFAVTVAFPSLQRSFGHASVGQVS
jgi:hypothetical protein